MRERQGGRFPLGRFPFNDVHGKAVIVTGASSGIGYATALLLADRGARVVAAARSAEQLAGLQQQARARGGELIAQVTDVTDPAACRALVDRCIAEFGGVDILINNAGVSMRALTIDTDIAVLQRVMDVNFWGTVYCTKAALPWLLKSPRGVLVGISSVAGFHGLPGRSGYSASKFAMHGLLESIRIEHLPDRLHVLVVAPGFTRSGIRAHALTGDGREQSETPRNEAKLMSPEKVAAQILRAIRWRKRNRIVSFEAQFVALAQRIVPHFVDWLVYRSMAQEPARIVFTRNNLEHLHQRLTRRVIIPILLSV